MTWPKYSFVFVVPGGDDLSAATGELFVSLMVEQRWPEAVRFYESLLSNNPGCYPAANALALVAYENLDFTAATVLLGSLVKKDPVNPIWMNNLGVVAAVNGDLAVARGLLRQAGALAGESREILYNLGCLAVSFNDLDVARDIFLRIIKTEPEHLQALFALSRIGKELGLVDEAIKFCRKLVTLAPEEAEFRQNLGILLLKSGNWQEGFELYESRWQANQFEWFSFDKLWQGESLSGKTILIWSEQGLGDTLQFVRYLPLLKEQAESVVLLVQEALLELLRLSFPDIAIKPFSEKHQMIYDFQLPLLNLPRFFWSGFNLSATAVPYLKVSAKSRNKWRSCLTGASDLRVGLVWAGNPEHKNDANRSIPLKLFQAIFALDGVRFFGLQKDQTFADKCLISTFLSPEVYGEKFIDLASELNDFQDTAAILQQLDLLISVDTSVAHLAGALACPVWLMLPFDADWRWLLERDDSPWYPSMRLFRQPEPGAWQTVINEIAMRLENRSPAFRFCLPFILDKSGM